MTLLEALSGLLYPNLPDDITISVAEDVCLIEIKNKNQVDYRRYKYNQTTKNITPFDFSSLDKNKKIETVFKLRDHKWSQIKIASLLIISQASVSNYLKQYKNTQ
jgi:hypothetical protein